MLTKAPLFLIDTNTGKRLHASRSCETSPLTRIIHEQIPEVIRDFLMVADVHKFDEPEFNCEDWIDACREAKQVVVHNHAALRGFDYGEEFEFPLEEYGESVYVPHPYGHHNHEVRSYEDDSDDQVVGYYGWEGNFVPVPDHSHDSKPARHNHYPGVDF